MPARLPRLAALLSHSNPLTGNNLQAMGEARLPSYSHAAGGGEAGGGWVFVARGSGWIIHSGPQSADFLGQPAEGGPVSCGLYPGLSRVAELGTALARCAGGVSMTARVFASQAGD